MSAAAAAGEGTAPRRPAVAPLPQEEFDAVFARVPRLTVEVVVAGAGGGLLLTQRLAGPCAGLWHIPGGTVRYGEPLADAVRRVAQDELGLEVEIERLLGYIEYPSHLRRGLGWPVGVAFRTRAAPAGEAAGRPVGRWFRQLPAEMHDEQRAFLCAHDLGR